MTTNLSVLVSRPHRVAATVCLIVLAALGVLYPLGSRAEVVPRASDGAIDDAIAFREWFGYRSDRSFVADLQRDPSGNVDNRAYPVVFTVEEASDWEARLDLEEDGVAVQRFYANNPARAGDFGGVRIDHRAGGLLAVYLRDGAATPWSDDLNRPARLEIRSASESWATLAAIKAEVQAVRPDPDWTVLNGVWIDLDRSAVVIGIDASAFDDQSETDRIRARFGLGPIVLEPYASHDYPTLIVRGGYGFHEDSVTGDFECSFGFRLTTTRQYLTAGHCAKGNTGDAIFRGSGRVGEYASTYQFANYEDGDVGHVILDSDHTLKTQVDYAGYALSVGGVSNACVNGAFRYVTGGEGGTGWGEVSECDYQSEYESKSGGPSVFVNHMVKYLSGVGSGIPSNWPIDGDSGGPVYTVSSNDGLVTARGLQGSHGTWGSGNNTHWYAAYSRLGDVPNAWGDVKTDPTDTCTLAPPTPTCPSA